MRRIKYISVFSRELSEAEIAKIEAVSRKNNAEIDVTGAMLVLGDVFFQILEGPPGAVGALFERIAADDRHQDLVLLRDELGVQDRLFGSWSMKRIDVGRTDAAHAELLRGSVESLRQQMMASLLLTTALERAMWREYSALSGD